MAAMPRWCSRTCTRATRCRRSRSSCRTRVLATAEADRFHGDDAGSTRAGRRSGDLGEHATDAKCAGEGTVPPIARGAYVVPVPDLCAVGRRVATGEDGLLSL